MKRMMMVVATALLASQVLAAGPRVGDRRPARERGVSWVRQTHLSIAETERAVAEATALEAAGNRPIALIETNYYTFLPNEPVQVRVTIHPNGFTSAATLYLYRENRTTGERLYYNAASRGFLAAGQSADLFGAAGAPAPIVVPSLNDFVLFGTATDSSTLGWGVNGALGASFVVSAGETGLYQWVLELRDAAGKRVISRSNAMYSLIERSENVSGTITASTTWSAKNRYVLNDFVRVVPPAVLTIEPGTVIYGGSGRATLFIQRGAKIVADGTARRPIVFTSPQKVGSRAQRDWGSLVVLGGAPINETSGQAFLEGLPSQPEFSFGGSNAADSSGILRYVRLEFGGFEIEANQEINGLTLAGVGNGTTVEYIEVLHNKDDAFEFFGGTVNARYLLGIAFADDGLDWDLGYQGNIQFAAMIKRGVNDENDGNVLIEADGHPQNFTLTPLSNPRLYNVTGYGTGRTDVGNYGVVMRRGTAGKIYNAILTGSRRAPVTLRDDATFNNATRGDLVFDSSVIGGSFADSAFTSSDRASQTRTLLLQTMTRNRNTDPMLAVGAPDLTKTLMPDLTPLPDSPALDAQFVANPPDNGFFQQVDFIGAVGPGNNWVLSGWANFSDN